MEKDTQESDDNTLLEYIQQGSHTAFATLVNRHAQRFYRVAYRLLGQREEAQDKVQDAFLKLWERPEIWQVARGVKFTTWFYRIVINLCIDAQKRKKPLPLKDDVDYADTRALQDAQLEDNQQQQRLEAAIQALPDNQRIALNLCFYEGMSNQEAADIMQLNIKALQSLLMRAKTTMKEKMKQQEKHYAYGA